MTQQPSQNIITFQVTAGGGREAFLRFTPHQFQAYLQHFHLLSFPSRLETLLLFKSDVSRNVTPLHVSNRRKKKKIKHKKEKKNLTKGDRAPIQNGCWNIVVFFFSVLPAAVNPLVLLSPFPRQKKQSPVRQSLPSFSSERLHVFFFFPPPWLLVRSTSVRNNSVPKKSADLIQSLSRLVDVSVERAAGQSPRCHSSLLSPVWVCIWGTGTTRATAANKGPLSGSACCTQWHQLSPPTSQQQTHNEGEETATTHTHKQEEYKHLTGTYIYANIWDESSGGLIKKFEG